jgi:flagellar assembly factor FliW
MTIWTTRFGKLDVEPHDIIDFPAGLIGLEACQLWVLLADEGNEALAWLQSADRPDVALATVSPRRFVSDYQIRVNRSELAPLRLPDAQLAQALVVIGKLDDELTLNLKSPLLLNVDQRIGRQVVNKSAYSLRHRLSHREELRRSA